MGHEFRSSIELDFRRIDDISSRLEPHKPRSGNSRKGTFLTPNLDGALRVGKVLGSIDRQQRSAIDADVAVILKGLDHPADVFDVVVFVEFLLDDELVS